MRKQIVTLGLVGTVVLNTKFEANAAMVNVQEESKCFEMQNAGEILQSEFSQEEIDEKLKNIGTPEEVLNAYTIEEKIFMWNNLNNSDAEFMSFEEGILGGEKVGVNTRSITTVNGMEAALTYTATAFKTTVKGKSCVAVYPAFNWSTNDEVRNDYFGCALAEGWELMADVNCSFRLFAYNGNNLLVNTVQYNGATDVSLHGAGFYIEDGGVPLPQNGHFRGMAILYAEKKNASASNKVAINYAHDYTGAVSADYSVTIGALSVDIEDTPSTVSYGKIVSFTYK